MTICNNIPAGETTVCGKFICCFDCPEKATCKNACECLADAETCEYRVTEENSLSVMQTEISPVIQKVVELEIQKKVIEDSEKAFREQLIQAMERYGVKSFKSGTVTFTYVAPTTKETLDSKALKAELPDIANRFTKTSSVKASVRISVKG